MQQHFVFPATSYSFLFWCDANIADFRIRYCWLTRGVRQLQRLNLGPSKQGAVPILMSNDNERVLYFYDVTCASPQRTFRTSSRRDTLIHVTRFCCETDGYTLIDAFLSEGWQRPTAQGTVNSTNISKRTRLQNWTGYSPFHLDSRPAFQAGRVCDMMTWRHLEGPAKISQL